jgi:nucleotide-binding universal stress UspA family protein
MNFRSILVHLDDTPRCAVRTALAARIARDQSGHLLGLAPTGLVNLPARVRPSMTGIPDYLELARKTLDERARALVGAFELRTRALGLESFEGRVDEADCTQSMLEHARCSDLIVLGQVDPASAVDAADRDLPQQVLMCAGRPVLAVPFVGAFDEVGRNVAVAWNDSRESARAVHDALPLLRTAKQVHLMSFERPSDVRRVTRLQLNDLRRALARHGVDAHLHQEVVRAGIGDKLLSRACDLDVDLIVMGGYGHGRAVEFVLGGVTRTLLAQMTVPVLFSH